MRIWKHIGHFLDNIERHISVIFIAVMFALVFYQVVLRYLFNSPNRWSEEAARYLHIYMIFICCSYAAKENAHIRIDAALNLYPKSLRPVIVVIGELVWIAFCVIVVIVSIRLTRSVARAGQYSVALRTPLWVFYAVIPFGYSLTIIRIIQNRYKSIRGYFSAKNAQQAPVEGGNS